MLGSTGVNCFYLLNFYVAQLTFSINYRYGKRTKQGIINDGWNALARYYFNNFADGTKQV